MADGNVVSFSKATEVQRLGSHTYGVNLVDSFCIGTGALNDGTTEPWESSTN